MQMNNAGATYQQTGSLQLFKLQNAIKSVKFKPERAINSWSIPQPSRGCLPLWE